MGTVCARCAEVKKAKGQNAPMRPAYDESSDDEEEGEGQEEVVMISSDDDGNEEDYKQGVAETLKSTGKALKRGKTMAMKEAISTAKKYNIAASAVAEAEKKLDDHKRQQRREEAEAAVVAFLASSQSGERILCEAILKKAVDAECSKETTERLKARLSEIIITRELEEEEVEQAREYLKESCRAFVLSATKPGGRPVLLLDLRSGAKTPSRLSLDPPLQTLGLRQEDVDESEAKTAPLSSLVPKLAKDDKAVRGSSGFTSLDGEESECVVALSCETGGERGVWCFVEPTPERRDRLVEAFVVLAAISG
uniref:Uncharacterized protein n=1 Tax=Alexandrium catenella TaxID=2925 RepID=A0A7S1RKI6_ALECA